MKKILIFSLAYPPFVGGAELAIKEITDRLEEIQFDLVTLRFDSSLPRFARVGNVNVYRLGFTQKNPTMADLVKFPLALNKYLFPFLAFIKACQLHRKNKYDATWSMMANYAGFAALFFKLRYPRVPFLLTLQEGDPIEYIKKRVRFVYQFFKLIFTKADFIQPISNYLADFARSMGFAGALETVPNAVDVEHFSQSFSPEELNRLATKLNKRETDRFIITTSRLVLKNAVDDVIKSLVFLPANIKFLIIGTGPDLEKLQNLAKDQGVFGRVIFYGYVDHKDMPPFLKISDIFIRPSLSEGLGNSFLEAMAAGLPVIATPVGGIPDFLIDGKTGWFCKTRNPESIAEKIKYILSQDNREVVKQVIVNASLMVSEKYNWNIIAQKMEQIFLKLTN